MGAASYATLFVICIIFLASFITFSLSMDCVSYSSCGLNEFSVSDVPDCIIVKKEDCPQSLKLKNNCGKTIAISSDSGSIELLPDQGYFMGYDMISQWSGLPSYEITAADIMEGWANPEIFENNPPSPVQWSWSADSSHIKGTTYPGKSAVNCYYLKKMIYIDRLVVILLFVMAIVYLLLKGGVGFGPADDSEF